MRWLALLLIPLLAGCLTTPQVPIQTGEGLLGFDSTGRSLPDPVPLGDCDAALETLNTRVFDQAQTRLDEALQRGYAYLPYRYYAVDAEMAADAPMAAPSAGEGGTKDAEVTGTNNQEAGADEADLIKTDGVWTYVLASGQLHILRSDVLGEIREVAAIPYDRTWGGQLLLDKQGPGDDDDLLIVITASTLQSAKTSRDVAWGSGVWYQPVTHIEVLALENRTSPEVIAEHSIQGHVSGARLIDGVVHVVVSAYEPGMPLQQHLDVDPILRERNLTYQDYWEMKDASRKSILAQAYARATAENERQLANMSLEDHLPLILHDGDPEAVDPAVCGRLLSPEDGTGRSVNTIFSLDAGRLEHRTIQVIGSSPIVYAAPGALVLVEQSQDWWWFWDRPTVDEATNVHWFDIDGLSVAHRASGRVAGTVQDSFSVDVKGDDLRVITTTGQWGRWWLDEPEPMKNHLVVFKDAGDELIEVGAVSGFAPTERVWSARFTDDRAYVVTFRQVDPLWVIDLSVSQAPRILGELHIPGVSTYLHPISDDQVLAFGIGPQGEDGLDWSRQQVSLFDVSDPTNPRRSDVLDLAPPGTGWSWSGATHEHKSFTYWDKLGMLAVPMTITYEMRDAGRYEERYRTHMGLSLIQVDGDELSIYGNVDQNHLVHDRWGGQIERSYFIGFPDEWPQEPVSVVSISQQGVTAHDLESLELQSTVKF